MVEPGTNHIERVFNVKYPKEYTERPEKVLANQAAFAEILRKNTSLKLERSGPGPQGGSIHGTQL